MAIRHINRAAGDAWTLIAIIRNPDLEALRRHCAPPDNYTCSCVQRPTFNGEYSTGCPSLSGRILMAALSLKVTER